MGSRNRVHFNVLFLCFCFCFCLGGCPFSTSPCPYFTLHSSSTKYILRNDLTLPKQTSWTQHARFEVQRQLPCHSLVCWQTEMRIFVKVWPNGPSSSSRHPPCTLISVSCFWWRDLWGHFKDLLLFLLDYKCFRFYMHLYPLGSSTHTCTPAAQLLIHTQSPNIHTHTFLFFLVFFSNKQLLTVLTSWTFLGHSSFEKYSWPVWVSAFISVQQGILYSLLDSGEPPQWPWHLRQCGSNIQVSLSVSFHSYMCVHLNENQCLKNLIAWHNKKKSIFIVKMPM